MPSAQRAAWRRLEQVVDAAIDAGLHRADCLDEQGLATLLELCAGDREMAREAAELLERMHTEGDVVDTPLEQLVPELLSSVARSQSRSEESTAEDLRRQLAGEACTHGSCAGNPSQRIVGSYRLLEMLGRGGMGVVYCAERADEEFEKQVALKLLPQGLETEQAQKRFRIERQILARLEHPGIARLLDGGVTEEGSPYLVMELVKGEPIDRYCDEKNLSVRQRVELFLQVCEAVRYAHRNLVVHRDLKPSNCLVTEEGQVKLLDFGIAKLMADDAPGVGTVLQPMTPHFASPEQLANEPVSTVSDVYSLGLLLYRLLAGAGPFELEGRTLGEMVDLVRTHEPPAPSARRLGASGEARHQRLARAMGVDLDVIVLKSMRFDANERYGAVADLQEDLRRYLEGRPILARPVSPARRFLKFVARHRAATSVAVLFVLLVVAGVSTIYLQGRAAARERDRAQLQAARAERVVGLLTDLLASSGADSVGSGERTAREVFAEAEQRARRQLAADPIVLASLLEVMAVSHVSFAEDEVALSLAREAVELVRDHPAGGGVALGRALTTLANVRRSRGDVQGLEEMLSSALEEFEREGAGSTTHAARTHRELGLLYLRRQRLEEAMQHARLALDLFAAEGDEVQAAFDRTLVALVLNATGQIDESLLLNRQALEVFERVYGVQHPNANSTRNNIASSLMALGRYEEAEEIYRASYEAAASLWGENGRRTATPLANLSRALLMQGEASAAEEPARLAASILEILDESHPSRIGAMMNLASVELALGDVTVATALYRRGVQLLRELTGEDARGFRRASSLLGLALVDAGELDEAGGLLTSAAAWQRENLVQRPHADLGESLLGMAQLAALQQRCGEARSLLVESLANLPAELPAQSPLMRRRLVVEENCASPGDRR